MAVKGDSKLELMAVKGDSKFQWHTRDRYNLRWHTRNSLYHQFMVVEYR
jgi:hypothetical protein